MKNTKTNHKNPYFNLASLFIYFLVMLVFFSAKDFVKEVISNDVTYEVRCETIDELGNGQQIYQLFKNGEYFRDIDINEYSLLDENGNTDYRYCSLIYAAKKLTYAIFFIAMLIFVTLIVNSAKRDATPFTEKNTNRIKAIALLQLGLSIFPSLVVFVMKIVKFGYIHSAFSIEGFYNIILFAIIMFIAQVFGYGVRLQQDNDLIA